MEKLSPPVRIFALVAVLAAVGGLLFMFTMGRASAPEAIPVAPATVTPTPTPVTPKVKPKPVVKAKAAPVVKPKPKPAAPAKPATPPSGFPTQIDAALRRHEVVVVSLVVPGSRVDELAAAEARAGAQAGGVGYLALNVLNESVGHALLTKLGSLEDPTLLVLKRPDQVVLQLPGFVDRETVAQAAANASS